ncbi:pentapeptide repeat-containing protein [bacterium]|nr:MAG: pentapeptide repeat-containing protein [bacterium]
MRFIRPKKPEPTNSDKASTEEILANIAECSKNAGKRLATYWVVWLYGMITLASINDKDIFLNTGVRLPIVNVTIPLTGFWLVFPAIIIVLFLLFTLLIFRLEDLLSTLPANVRGNAIRFYPWFWNIGRRSKSPIGRIRFTLEFTTWISAPIAILYNLWTCFSMHEVWIFLASFIIGISGSLIVASMVELCGFGVTISKTKRQLSLGEKLAKTFLYSSILALFIIVIQAFTQKPFMLLRKNHLDVSYQTLVNRPTYDHPNAYWIDLSARDYFGADLTSTVLRRSKLDKVNLEDSKLAGASLDSSSLRYSKMRCAILNRVNLESSNLYCSDFEHAVLDRANLANAILTDANLKSATLTNSRINSAYLIGSNLSYAKFDHTDLNSANLSEANMENTELSMANLANANLDRTTGLTVKQLKQSETLYNVRNLNQALRDSLEQCCGYLFVHPDSLNREDYPPFGDATWPPDSTASPL